MDFDGFRKAIDMMELIDKDREYRGQRYGQHYQQFAEWVYHMLASKVPKWVEELAEKFDLSGFEVRAEVIYCVEWLANVDSLAEQGMIGRLSRWRKKRFAKTVYSMLMSTEMRGQVEALAKRFGLYGIEMRIQVVLYIDRLVSADSPIEQTGLPR